MGVWSPWWAGGEIASAVDRYTAYQYGDSKYGQDSDGVADRGIERDKGGWSRANALTAPLSPTMIVGHTNTR